MECATMWPCQQERLDSCGCLQELWPLTHNCRQHPCCLKIREPPSKQPFCAPLLRKSKLLYTQAGTCLQSEVLFLRNLS